MLRGSDKPYRCLTESFWEGYLSGRPQVPETLFDRIFKYHADNGGKFGVLNDIGASIGNYSARLAKKIRDSHGH